MRAGFDRTQPSVVMLGWVPQSPPRSTADPAAPLSLVDQVAIIIANWSSDARPGNDARPAASAAIRAVAEWLRSDYPKREGYGTAWANLIEEEANR